MNVKGREVDVARIVEGLGLVVKADTGKELLLDCTWHNDDGSNLSINKGTGLYHCWVCGSADSRARGSLVHLVAVIKSITHVEAEEYILGNSSVVTKRTLLNDIRRAVRPRKERQVEPEEIWNEVDRYYNPRHPYWKGRGIDSFTADKFLLGYDNKRDHAIIPVTVGKTPIGLIRRTMGKVGPRYIYPSKEHGFFRNDLLFGIDRSKNNGLYITEGPIDCLKVHQAGFNGIAVLGASLSEAQSRLILEYDPEYLVLMTDEDAGGEMLSTFIWENFPMRNVYGVQLPHGKKDPGECNVWEIYEAIENKVHILTTYLPKDLKVQLAEG